MPDKERAQRHESTQHAQTEHSPDTEPVYRRVQGKARLDTGPVYRLLEGKARLFSLRNARQTYRTARGGMAWSFALKQVDTRDRILLLKSVYVTPCTVNYSNYSKLRMLSGTCTVMFYM